MSSNDDSPAPQPHSVQPGLSATSNKNPKIDTVDALLRTIFRMGWTDWTLTAILISCLINHYFFIILNVAQPIIDFTRLITALISVIFIAYKVVSGYKSKELITIFFKNHPLQLFVSIIACGATVSFFLPLILNLFRFIGETDKLTTALLASTGGVIAVFTLIKTHQKNQNDEQTLDLDRKKYNQQIKDRMEDLKLQEAERLEQKAQFEKNLEAQSEKNKQDHTRQAHAERRSRYAKAVEQLANEKAAVRLGGIYTLVGLVDEWLADDTLEQEEQQKEGQVIINNLCSYVRSPFTLALKAEMFEGDSEPDNYEGDFSKDQAAFHEEQDVRRTVFVEMSKRSSTFNRGLFGQIINTSLRMWSDFDFDFSRAPIFYPLNAITIEKGNFSGAKFYADANFFGATFISNADFSGAAFTQNANFSGAAFAQNADFIWAAFAQNADFSGATFTQNVNFSEATFTQNADFDEAVFFENANFSWAAFFEDANFSWATFTQNADFRGAKFTQNANFSGAAFIENANFSWAKFTQNADFHGAEFTQNADFSGATFKGIASFGDSTFEKYSPLFVTTNDELGETYRAQFVALPIDQEAHDFTVSEGSFRIPPGEAELGDGVKHHIPVGTVLFDPDSWDEEKQKYTRVSDPAKPLENSDTEEEKPAG
ncbi:hypothetical protein HMPREF2942_00930 [Rothia sp. HMSC071C12]|uniref:pentapeptide repeat-containing protein n=4 Tax=Rothia TaxID=32207 RepID=UPI0008A5B25C|nr:pentapeptide repeat-containing protein [Rothia sp. HMSC071C12]OFQ33233.1 hypothetical protein HMPREF2942_00930 [Rothia sp. HMSC071C12]